MEFNPDANDFCLRVPSDPRVLTIIRHLVETAGRLAMLDEAARGEIVLAVSEACENVIQYAHGGRPELPLSVVCHIVDDGLEVRLRDQGPPFDPLAAPELDPTESRLGGRGLFLIRRLTDHLEYVALPEGGNELRMVKRSAGV